MGHIDLAAPVVHIWFFKAMPSRASAALLDMKTSDMEKIIYFQDYVVIDPGQDAAEEEAAPDRGRIPRRLREVRRRIRSRDGRRGDQEAARACSISTPSRQKIRADIEKTNSKQKIKDLIKRLKMVEAIRDSENKAEWMVMDVIPVIPPDLRPLVLLESGNFATQRSERPVSPHHQPQQPAEEAGRPQRAGSHHPQRKAHAAAGGRCAVRQRPLPPPGARLVATARSSR